MKAVIEVEGLDQPTNAQLGLLEITLAELLTTEVTLDTDLQPSLNLLRQWKPLHPTSPSQKERTTLGVLSQTLGQVYEDKGDWFASAEELKRYLKDYVVTGSQNEGWAVGDYAQVLMEMGRMDDAESALYALISKRSTTNMADDEKNRDRRSDIMFIDIQWAECTYLRGRYPEAENLCTQLLAKFDSFGGDLWHFEKTRYFSILCALARIAQATKDYGKAFGFWEQALRYATDNMDTGFRRGKWCRNAFLVSVVIYSQADCLYGLGDLRRARTLREEVERTLNAQRRACRMLGLGTYWLEEVRGWMDARPAGAERLRPAEAESREET